MTLTWKRSALRCRCRRWGRRRRRHLPEPPRCRHRNSSIGPRRSGQGHISWRVGHKWITCENLLGYRWIPTEESNNAAKIDWITTVDYILSLLKDCCEVLGAIHYSKQVLPRNTALKGRCQKSGVLRIKARLPPACPHIACVDQLSNFSDKTVQLPFGWRSYLTSFQVAW